ncbi:MAG: GDP-mannose 6-dehydrogenase [Verrucomicrobia bacterium]|nr:GDP-mannose 6-dehydrogenase [Verrucomicrobiota bacterium]
MGAVITACFSRQGHTIIGVDTDAFKVGQINAGKSPIIEPELEKMLGEGVAAGRVSATSDFKSAVLDSEISMICVGTPSKPDGSIDLTYIRRVCENIGEVLRDKPSRHIVIIRSTMLPGSIEGTVIPALEKTSGKKNGLGFGVGINPEFLRESTAVHDFYNPPKTVIGTESVEDFHKVAELYDGIPGPMVHANVRTAEMVKYADNCFHALKIVFANEIGRASKALGSNADEVMRIFSLDTKLNLSPVYLKPGFCYGGSCLPKDLRAIAAAGRALGVELPLMEGIGLSNDAHFNSAFRYLLEQKEEPIAVLGFAFKAGTDDLRESPVVKLIEELVKAGKQVRLYDRNVSPERLIGANKKFIEAHLPHLSHLIVGSVDELVEGAKVIVVGNGNDEARTLLPQLGHEIKVVDLVSGGIKTSTKAAIWRPCA